MRYILSLALIAARVAWVAAHGYVDNATIGGTQYQLYQPYADPFINPAPQRISRFIAGNGPVEDVNSIDIQCGGWSQGGQVGSKPAALHAPVQAGSQITLRWTLWPDSHKGPLISYMARCPDGGCQSWQPGSSSVFFKVHEDGRQGTSDNWASSPLMRNGNQGYKLTIPSCLKPGYYLIRHETIALHASASYPGAQFYPVCIQVQVSGSGSTVPSNLVAFPGAYKGSDPGIKYDVYRASPYTIPGPRVFSC